MFLVLVIYRRLDNCEINIAGSKLTVPVIAFYLHRFLANQKREKEEDKRYERQSKGRCDTDYGDKEEVERLVAYDAIVSPCG